MPKTERAVLDVLFPEVRAKLLRLLFCVPPQQLYVRELMIRSGLALHTVQDELRKLSAVGLVTSWSNGYHRFYRANRQHALFEHLLRLVELSAKLPKTKHSALRRRIRAPRARKQPGGEARPLPVDRLLNLHSLAGVRKTRRL